MTTTQTTWTGRVLDRLTGIDAKQAARLFASLGGRSGTGEAKRRGTKAYYRALSAKAVKARWGGKAKGEKSN